MVEKVTGRVDILFTAVNDNMHPKNTRAWSIERGNPLLVPMNRDHWTYYPPGVYNNINWHLMMEIALFCVRGWINHENETEGLGV